MAYRIVSIENPAEVHVREGQLVVTQDRGEATIPVREMLVLVVCGPNIRMSTMAQTMLTNEKVVTLFLGRNHHPAAMLVPVVGCARQALVSRAISVRTRSAEVLNVYIDVEPVSFNRGYF